MKKHISLLAVAALLFTSLQASAEETNPGTTKTIKITIGGVINYGEYNTLLNDIKKIEGIIGLIPARERAGSLTVTGTFAEERSSVKNDIEALVLDRYKFTSKDSRGILAISLEKL